MGVNGNFVDILKPRHTQFGIIRFMSRSWTPKKTMQVEKEFCPQELRDLVANSVYMDSFLEAESVRQGVHKQKLKKEMLHYLNEIGFEKKMHVVRWVGMAFLKIAFMMKIGIFVNEPAILQIKESMGSKPVLFLPTHRSYADFCLMTYLCFHYDIDLPVVAAGMDFLSMAVVGEKMREMCAFYIRRTMVDAPVYGATLKHYVRTVVANYGAPFEFFIEGTRSRSNKSMPPRFGMISMALMPYFARQVQDMVVVPVNISYDRLMELTLFAYEHLGVPKPPESTQGLCRSIQSLNDHFGNIYINFGTPISLKEYFPFGTSKSEETTKPLDLHRLSKSQLYAVKDLANHVVAMQQQTTIVTISSLVSLVLMQSLMKSEPLHIDEVVPDVVWFSAILRDLGANLYECDLKAEVERMLVIHRRMFTLDAQRRLRLLAIPPALNLTRQFKAKMKGHVLRSRTMANAVPIIELQMCLNPVLHYLVPPAIIYLLVKKALVKDKGDCRLAYNSMRKVLSIEFFYEQVNETRIYTNAFEFCVMNNVIRCQGGALSPGNAEKFQSLLEWILLPSLTVLSYCIEIMAKEQLGEEQKKQQKEVQKRIQELGEVRGAHPYCLSLEVSANCLRGLAAAGALRRERVKGIVNYETIECGMRKYETLIKGMMPDFRPDLGPTNCVQMSRAPVASRL